MNNIRRYFEREFSFPQIVFLVMATTVVRVALEQLFLEYAQRLGPFQEGVRLYLENIYYFLILFLLLSFFISKLTGQTLKTVANFGMKVFPCIILPPILDHFLFGRIFGYQYGTMFNFWQNVLTLSFMSGEAGPGISCLILLALSLICGYVFYVKQSIWRTVAAWFGCSFIIILLSTPEIFVQHDDFFYQEFLAGYYYFPLLMLGVGLLFRQDKQKCLAVVKNLRLLRAAVFVMAVILGVEFSRRMAYPVYFKELFLTMVAVFFAWQFAVVVNDLSDIEIDRKSNRERPLPQEILSKSEYSFIATVFAFYALSFSVIINSLVFLSIVFWLLLGAAYSLPPIRLRRNIAGNFVIGTALVLSFWMGLFIFGAQSLIFDGRGVAFSAVLFLFGTVLTLSKDLKDLEADRAAGIKNLFSAFERNKAKKIMSVFLFAAFFMPVILFKNFFLWGGFFVFSILVGYLFYKKEDERIVYTLALGEGVSIFFLLLKA